MSYTTNNNYLITTCILIIITTVYLLNISQIAFSIQDDYPPFNDYESPPFNDYESPPINDTELQYICLPSNKNSTSSYNESRALVVTAVISTTASYQGFRNISFTWFRNSSSTTLDDPDTWCYGLAQCRGDVSADDCKKCVNNSAITLINTTNHCPGSRSAIIWRDYCLFKYSDVDFFGKLDTANSFSMFDGSEISISNDAISILMNSLLKTATASTMLYADGTQPGHINDPITLYGMVQCTRDLSIGDCMSCLGSAINQLPKDPHYNHFYKGGRVVYGSCFARYETYDFRSSASS